jgi:outer membrane receptor for ferrienterochelin and colicins
MIRARFVGCSVALILLCSLAGQARGDDTSELQGMLSETFVSGASKSTELGASAPAMTTTLTSDDLRRYGIHSLAEAIDFLSLGAFTSSNLGATDTGANGVIVPNDQGSHMLLLLNGHQMNEALFGAARFNRGAGIPMEMVDHIEVILGPGSVLYGSSAMLGVINVVTKEAGAFGGTHVVAESDVPTSIRIAAGGGYEFPLLGKSAKLALELEYFQQDGPALHITPQAYGSNDYTNQPYNFGGPTATGVWGGTADKSNYAKIPSGVLTFRLGEFSVGLQGVIFTRATPFNADFVTPEANFNDPNNYARDRRASIDVTHTHSLSAVTQIRSRVYADTFDYRRYADTSALGPADCIYAVPTCRRTTFGASRWVGAEEQVSFDWFKDARLVTLLGGDARVRWMLAQNDVLNPANNQPLGPSTGVLRASDAIAAAYAQQTWKPTRWLGLNGGARFDYDGRFGGHVSPRIAAAAEVWRGATLKAIYSEAYRAPSWEESSVSADNQIAAGQLRPETVRSVQVVVDQRLGSHRFRFGAFRSWWSEMVELHTLTLAETQQAQSEGLLSLGAQSGTQYRNVSSIDNMGFDLGYEGSFAQARLRYGLNLTGAIARRSDATGSEVPLVIAPQVFGNARVSYDLPGDLPTIAVAGHFLGTRPVDRAYGDGFVPTPYAPAFAEVRGTVTGPFPVLRVLRGLSYRLSANYAFTDRGPYVVGPFQTGPVGAVPTSLQKSPTTPLLNPIEQFRLTVGLQYDF